MGSELQYQGKAMIRANGRELPTNEGANFEPGGEQRSPVIGYRVYGFKTTPKQATLTATIPNHASISLKEIDGMVDATIIFEADTGQKWLMARAWNTGESSLSGGGDISTTFHAVESQEL